jgi:hypothetical protein
MGGMNLRVFASTFRMLRAFDDAIHATSKETARAVAIESPITTLSKLMLQCLKIPGSHRYPNTLCGLVTTNSDNHLLSYTPSRLPVKVQL